MDYHYLLVYSRLLSSLAFLGLLGVQDLKRREVSPSIVFMYLGVSASLFVFSTVTLRMPAEQKLLYSLVSLTVTLGAFISLYMRGLVGNGDVYVSSAIGLCFSYPDIYSVTFAGRGVFLHLWLSCFTHR